MLDLDSDNEYYVNYCAEPIGIGGASRTAENTAIKRRIGVMPETLGLPSPATCLKPWSACARKSPSSPGPGKLVWQGDIMAFVNEGAVSCG